jgi:hypothetical protein
VIRPVTTPSENSIGIRVSGGEPGAHQVHVGVDAAGDHQQAAGIDLVGAGHGATELGDPAVGCAHVGLHPVTGRHDRAMADNQVKTLLPHPRILARRWRPYRRRGSRPGALRCARASRPGAAALGPKY